MPGTHVAVVVAVVLAARARRAADGGAGLATPPQLRQEQWCTRLNVAFGVVDSP